MNQHKFVLLFLQNPIGIFEHHNMKNSYKTMNTKRLNENNLWKKAIAQASVLPLGGVLIRGPIDGSTILQGPSARATILGPDGSLIKSSVDGGVVLANRGLGLGLGSGIVSAGVPLLSKGSTVVVAGPAAPGGVIIAGPSGTIATGNGVGKSVIGVPIATRVVSVPQIISGSRLITSDLGLGGLGLGLGGHGLGGIGLGGIALDGIALDGRIIGNGHELW